MIYTTPDDWLAAPEKRVALFGMSGLGKTHVASLLRASGGWFHYSIDYRIGTRYMGEHIADNFKAEAMKLPLLRELLLTDSVYIQSNITFDNLAPLSTYLGKPGDPARGGLPFDEYRRRQDQHRVAEIAALMDTPHFIARAKALYGYPNFVCDTGGSICEVVNPDDPDDPVLRTLSDEPAAGRDRGIGCAYRRTGPPLRPRAQADVLPPRFPGRRLGGIRDRQAAGPDRPRRLRALDLCPRAGAPPAALCRDGAELGRLGHSRGYRPRQFRRRVRRADRPHP
jgi:hypothetical protein